MVGKVVDTTRAAIGYTVGAASGVALVVYVFLVVLYLSVNTKTQEVTDGFGRTVTEAPWWLKMARIEHWAGIGWMCLDTVLMFALLGIAIGTFRWAKKEETSK